MGRRGAAALILLVLAGTAVAGLVARRLWPLLEPARTLPLLPAWPWQRIAFPPGPQTLPLEGLSPGWRASALGNPAARRWHEWQRR